MKIKLYWAKDCKWCEKQKEEFKKLPKGFKKPIEIESANVDSKTKEELKIYPTLAFFYDDDRIIKYLPGFKTIEELKDAYSKALNLEYIQKKYKRLNKNMEKRRGETN
jgi:hypothetical protein